MKRKLIRVAASPISLDLLLKGQLNYLNGFFDVLAVASPERRMRASAAAKAWKPWSWRWNGPFPCGRI